MQGKWEKKKKMHCFNKLFGSRFLEEYVLFESRKESESITMGPFKRMRSCGSNDTNTYNLYICLFTGIFLDNCGSLTKIRAESQMKSREKDDALKTTVHNHTKYSMSRMMQKK